MKKFAFILSIVMVMTTVLSVPSYAVSEQEVEFRQFEDAGPEITETAAEVEGFDGSYIPETTYCQKAVWNIEPVIYRTNEAVCPGDVFYLYGEGLFRKEMQIAISPAKSNIPSDMPGSDAVYIDAVQTDSDSRYVAAKIPKYMKAGVFDVWIANAYGWSQPIRLNDARPEWFRDDMTAQGMVAAIYGKNMDCAEFGGKTDSHVILKNSEHTYEVPVISTNPFRIEFGIPGNVEAGEYEVYVSNDGIVYHKQSSYRNELLKVFAAQEDPFNLNVGWSEEFIYDVELNVKDFGAVGDGVTDDYPAIQAAIEKVNDFGGGIVYIPDGVYRCDGNIVLHDKIILRGESQDGTKIIYAYSGEDRTSRQAISVDNAAMSSGRVGLYNFTFENDPSIIGWPDFFVWLGNDWGAISANRKKSQFLFIKNITLKCELIASGYGRGMGINVVADSHVLMDGIKTYGCHMTAVHCYINAFTSITDSDWYTTADNIGVNGAYITMTNNKIYRFGIEYFQAGVIDPYWKENLHEHPDNTTFSQGIFSRGPAYIAHNIIENTGMPGDNDGEMICTENAGGGTKLYAGVVSAAADTVTVNELFPDKCDRTGYDWDYSNPGWGEKYTIMIISGRGTGQYARINSANPDTKTFTLDREWKILPDSTSKIITMTSSESFIIYDNTLKNGEKGLWLFGDTIGCVIADNKGTNMEGVFIWTNVNMRSPQIIVNYFNRVDRNYFNGPSSGEMQICQITASVDVSWGETADLIAIYGTNIRRNIIENSTKPANMNALRPPESARATGINIVHRTNRYGASEEFTMQSAALIENCIVRNCYRGLALGGYNDEEDIEPSRAYITGNIIVRNVDISNNTVPFLYNHINGLVIMNDE
ncbi:MAG: hypothetical protein J6N52_08290 [Clostridia bacterium]|nr:hypothetical protein [Clostridia bacterium]